MLYSILCPSLDKEVVKRDIILKRSSKYVTFLTNYSRTQEREETN